MSCIRLQDVLIILEISIENEILVTLSNSNSCFQMQDIYPPGIIGQPATCSAVELVGQFIRVTIIMPFLLSVPKQMHWMEMTFLSLVQAQYCQSRWIQSRLRLPSHAVDDSPLFAVFIEHNKDWKWRRCRFSHPRSHSQSSESHTVCPKHIFIFSERCIKLAFSPHFPVKRISVATC